jgi:hypothetical protein
MKTAEVAAKKQQHRLMGQQNRAEQGVIAVATLCVQLLIVQRVNVEFSLCLIKHCTMKKYWRVKALDGSEWSASGPGRFWPRDRTPSTHWMGPRVSLDAVANTKSLSPSWKSNL